MLSVRTMLPARTPSRGRGRTFRFERGGQPAVDAGSTPPPPPAAEGWGDLMCDEPIDEARACLVSRSSKQMFVFHCNRSTERECLERLVFGARDNPTNRKKLSQITAETQLFLFNIESKMAHGAFCRKGSPASSIQPSSAVTSIFN